jgi:hypothetical protein
MKADNIVAKIKNKSFMTGTGICQIMDSAKYTDGRLVKLSINHYR